MKAETIAKVKDWIATHQAHENLKRDIAAGTGLGTTTINIVIDILLRDGSIREARMFGNAKAYEVVSQ